MGGPHGGYDCDKCTGQCRERESKYGCANPVGNDGVHGCYCSPTKLFVNQTRLCEGNGCEVSESCHLSHETTTNSYCPPLKGPNGTCAIGKITSDEINSCKDCYDIGGAHNFHYACYDPHTKRCRVTENECASHSPPCGNIPGWCPCPHGWETCYS